MPQGLVLTTPTYNSLEYLQLFMESYMLYAAKYPLVIVIDGSTDGTIEYLKQFKQYKTITVKKLDKNHSKPYAYNTGIQIALDKYKAEFICLLNDDMVFSETWNQNITNYVDFMHQGNYIKLNLAEPYKNTGKIYYPVEGKLDIQEFNRWASSYEVKNHLCYQSKTGTPFPLITTKEIFKKYKFDERYAGGGCCDTDFCYTMTINNIKHKLLYSNILFHFIGGSNNKIKQASKWIEHGQTFKNKWNVKIEVATKMIEQGQVFD